jgi:hypothetical protein
LTQMLHRNEKANGISSDEDSDDTFPPVSVNALVKAHGSHMWQLCGSCSGFALTDDSCRSFKASNHGTMRVVVPCTTDTFDAAGNHCLRCEVCSELGAPGPQLAAACIWVLCFPLGRDHISAQLTAVQYAELLDIVSECPSGADNTVVTSAILGFLESNVAPAHLSHWHPTGLGGSALLAGKSGVELCLVHHSRTRRVLGGVMGGGKWLWCWCWD